MIVHGVFKQSHDYEKNIIVYCYSILSIFFTTIVSKLRLTEVRVTLDFDSFNCSSVFQSVPGSCGCY